jgi:hypothetical protein
MQRVKKISNRRLEEIIPRYDVMPRQSIHREYQRALGAWTGCSWETEFYTRKLNLNGVTARQAYFLAEATSGSEAESWHAAVDWLKTVEDDAKIANDLGEKAYEAVLNEQWDKAAKWIEKAVNLEAKYPAVVVWSPLKELILGLPKISEKHGR